MINNNIMKQYKKYLHTSVEEPYEYKSELQLMQEAYEGCCGRPGCKHQMDAFKKHPLPYEPAEEDAEGEESWEDDFNDDGMDDTYDSDMVGYEEDVDEIDPSDLAEITSDVNEFIKDKLIEFGYPESLFNDVVSNLSDGAEGLASMKKPRAIDYDARDSYDEENWGYDEDEDEELPDDMSDEGDDKSEM